MSDAGAATREHPCTILLAEDDVDIREIVAATLRNEGWRVVEASSGDRALAIALTERIDAIVTDQRMPGLTGAELIERLRADGRALPAILVTAAREVRAIASAHRIHCYLGKPFGIDDLVETVRRALAGEC